MLLEQLFFALRLDGLPVDLQGRGFLRDSKAASTDGDAKAGPGQDRKEDTGQGEDTKERDGREGTFMIEVVFLAGAAGVLVHSQSRSIWCGAGAAMSVAMPAKSFRRRRALRQRARTVVSAARALTSCTAWLQALHGQQNRP